MPRFVQIDLVRLAAAHEAAMVAMTQLCNDVQESVRDEPERWVFPHDFRYFELDPDDGTVVAEPIQAGGPREPGLIWSGAIAMSDGARWFCSEDAEGSEKDLGWQLSELAPGGIGGF